jgi:hypothetical protein
MTPAPSLALEFHRLYIGGFAVKICIGGWRRCPLF